MGTMKTTHSTKKSVHELFLSCSNIPTMLSSSLLRREKRHRQPSEREESKLATAIKTASVFSSLGMKGCSIVVQEGLYIDPTACFGEEGMVNALKWRKDFSLEIVGIEEVRILSTSTIRCLFRASQIELSMRNISIYRRSNGWQDTFSGEAVKLSLGDIRVHGWTGCVLNCGQGSELMVSNCAFSEFKNAFLLEESDAVFQLLQWAWSHLRAMHHFVSASLFR